MRIGHNQQDRVVLLGFVLVILASACGGDGATTSVDGTDTTASPATSVQSTTVPSTAGGGQAEPTTSAVDAGDAAPPAGGGECTVTISGDRDESWTFEQATTSFSTDYWLAEEDLREVIEFMGEDITGGSYDELVAAGMPIVTFLQISCSDPANLIQGALVTHTNATLSSDLPMGSGSYAISGGLFDADGPAGTVIADLSVNEDEVYGTIEGSGSLEVTRWDLDGIEGSFSFAAQEAFVDNPAEIEVAVSFSFVCSDWFSGC